MVTMVIMRTMRRRRGGRGRMMSTSSTATRRRMRSMVRTTRGRMMSTPRGRTPSMGKSMGRRRRGRRRMRGRAATGRRCTGRRGIGAVSSARARTRTTTCGITSTFSRKMRRGWGLRTCTFCSRCWGSSRRRCSWRSAATGRRASLARGRWRTTGSTRGTRGPRCQTRPKTPSKARGRGWATHSRMRRPSWLPRRLCRGVATSKDQIARPRKSRTKMAPEKSFV
mmetsp:Transcript_49747/g.118390  ORF Transcript_49747/g.118390 Transcript_49747/m.118390 type:complete len:224 (+) Transcript_49747:58-729(+)